MAKARIALAANFERNLEAIGVFLAKAEAPAGVLDDLVDAIVMRPRAGRDWRHNPPPTESGKALQQRIAAKLQGRRELREFVLDQHLVLYAIDGNTVTLLAVRHSRELGFDVG